MSQGQGGGRPVAFKTLEELKSKIDAYFDYCDHKVIKRIVNKKGDLISEVTKPYTVCGLASFLEVDRQTITNYGQKDKFFAVVKKARDKIEAEYEERALTGDSNTIMSIFCLKNHFKWQDKQDVDFNMGKDLAGLLFSTKYGNKATNREAGGPVGKKSA